MDRLLNAWSNIRETLNTIDLYDPQEVETRIDWIQTRALLKQELLASGKPPSWISATKATRLSEKLDLPLTLPAITKLAQKNPPAFQSRSVRGNRREVDIGSFVAYLLSQKNLPGNKDEEDDSMSKTDIRKRMELERKKKEAERDVGDYPE